MKKALISTCVLTALSLPVQAEQLENESSITPVLDRIIITGSRIQESMDEVPASVTIINREEIENQIRVNPSLQNILANQVPGMAPSTGSVSNFGQSLRGRSPLIMVDGVPQSTPLRNGLMDINSLDASMIERIEVIKGATSIYGNGASGGIINYITKQPSGDDSLIELGLSSKASLVKFEDSQGYRIDALLDGTAEQFSYVFSASQEETGYARDAEGDIIGQARYGLSEFKTQSLFSKLRYELDSEKYLQFTYAYYEGQQQGNLITELNSVNDGIKTYAYEAPKGERQKEAPQGPRGNHNIMLKYVDDAFFSDTQLVVDLYQQDVENVFYGSTKFRDDKLGLDGGQSYVKAEKVGIRGQLNTVFEMDNSRLMLIYGTDILNDTTSQPLLDGRVWTPEMEMDNLAVFMQSKYTWQDQWVFKAGVRHDNIDVEVDDFTTIKQCKKSCVESTQVKGDTLSYSVTTYNFGLRHVANELFSPFVNFSQGADITDLGLLLRGSTVPDINKINTEASITDHYEVGFSSQLNHDLRLTGALFKSTSKLGTVSKQVGNSGVYRTVRAPQKIWGYEAALDYQWSQTLQLGVNYSWLEGKNTEEDVYLGARQITPPKLTAHIDWQPLDDMQLALSYLHVADRKKFDPVDGFYEGDQAPISSYDVVNVSAQYILDNWTLFAGIENLFNEDYYHARAQGFVYEGLNNKALGTTLNIGFKVSL